MNLDKSITVIIALEKIHIFRSNFCAYQQIKYTAASSVPLLFFKTLLFELSFQNDRSLFRS